MATPKVDTFEHDIVAEIKRREATLSEIAATTKETAPKVEDAPKKTSILTITLITLLILSTIGLGAVGYYYFHDSLLPPSAKSVTVSPDDIPKVMADITKLSPSLGTEIGRFISKVEKKNNGYILTITNYSSVFAYMTRNEEVFAPELILALQANLIFSSTVQKGTSTQLLAATTTYTSTPRISTSTKLAPTTLITVASTTKKTVKATSTKPLTKVSTSTPKIASEAASTVLDLTISSSSLLVSIPSTQTGIRVSDITVENQNMRVITSSLGIVIYAFVGDSHVLISNSQEGILALRNAILH